MQKYLNNHKNHIGETRSNGKNKDDKSRQEAVSTIFPCERYRQTVELSRTLWHAKFPIPLSLADTAGLQLHHTQKSYLRGEH